MASNKTRTAVRNELLWRSVVSILPIKVDTKEIQKWERKYTFELPVKLYTLNFIIKEDIFNHPHFMSCFLFSYATFRLLTILTS